MNTSKTIGNARPVGGNYFYLKYLRSSEKYLKDYVDLFNPNDYYIFKCTDKQRLLTYEEFLDFKYSGYIFFKKELYCLDYINMWLDYMKEKGMMMKFLVKPFPPFNPNKIKIKS